MRMPAVGSNGAPDGHPLLVTGMPERTRENMGWRESLTDIIRKKWSSRRPSPRTKQAESGLGIEGTPHYFYAMRTERAFGFAVFFFRVIHITRWPEGAHGATPFDSGGLWYDKVCTIPSADSLEKRKIFRTHQKPLSSWLPAFEEYITSNYDSIDEYVRGTPPRMGVNPIISGPPNSSRAWTWEVRIPGKLMEDGVEIFRGFLSEEDRRKYLDWLWNDSDYDDGICKSIDRWMRDKMTFAPPGVPALKAAESVLLGISVQ